MKSTAIFNSSLLLFKMPNSYNPYIEITGNRHGNENLYPEARTAFWASVEDGVKRQRSHAASMLIAQLSTAL